MTIRKSGFVLLILLFSLGLHANTQTPTRYDDNIRYGQYISNPRAVIVSGMKQHGWQIQSEAEGEIEAILNKPENQVVVRIGFTGNEIWFKPVSDVSTDCSSKKGIRPASCPVEADRMIRWRINLRKAILKQIEAIARIDALNQYSVSSGWYKAQVQSVNIEKDDETIESEE